MLSDNTTNVATDIDASALLVAALAKAGITGESPITGEEVDFHDSPKITLPRGMSYEKAFKVLKRLQEEAETPTDFRRIFQFRADDGAYAAAQVIKNRYGMLLGKQLDMGFFGKLNAQTRTIKVGVGQTQQVPWGLIEIPTCPGLELYLAEVNDKDYGRVFAVQGSGPRKWRDEVDALFNDIQEFLQTRSIYRGQALVGSDDLDFLDLSTFDASKVIFSDDVTAVLDGTLFAPIRYAESMRAENIPLKRAILLHGPFGTGKTSTGQIAAQVAVEHNWTFISAKPGRDKVEDVLRTARLYQPAVVFVEDIDGEGSASDSGEVTKLLEAFDGITSKGGELVVVMTTNHIERIHKGMLRPGRLDAVVEIASLDRNGVERLIKAVVDSSKLDENIDYDAVFEAMNDFYPAFVREAVNRAVTFSINRLGGSTDYVIGTPDLVGAALSLHDQLKALHDADEGIKPPTLDTAIKLAVESAVTGLSTYDGHNEEHYSIVKTQD